MNKIAFTLVVGAFAVYLASGFFIIAPDEQGVVRVFGRAILPYQPGIHYTPPWPVSRLDRVKVSGVKRVYVGQIVEALGDEMRLQHAEEQEYITGDINILNLKLVVRYKIKDAIMYLFNVSKIHYLVEFFTETALSSLTSVMSVDEVLTSGKSVIQIRVRQMLQKSIDSLDCGIHITSVQFREVSPPIEVADAFNNVWTSKQEREKVINEAEGYRNQQKHLAKGASHEELGHAEGRQQEFIQTAQGKTKSFLSMEKEYRKAPRLTRKRLYFEKIEKIMGQVNKVIAEVE
ncbi:MAG: FtsH protease activity modulator HflK [Fibrobacteria bacterium]|nr:FtsH protease activity modulator HflK [Fibrobacteria bacterium]